MKNMKKLIVMAIAVIMVMSMTTVAFAANTYTITLEGTQEGHTYEAYQIFTGDLSGSTLSNIVWGSGVNADGQAALGNAADKAETLKNVADAEAFAAEVAPYLSETKTASADGKISDLVAGYYLIKTATTTAENGVYTYYIMKIVKDTTATIKADVPSVEKSVDDDDVNIGDKVTYTITATMPSNLQGYETYKVIFKDTLSEGLDFVENSAKVTVDGADKTADFTISESNGALTVSCADVIALGATTDSAIVLTYDVIIDTDAVIGTEGNENTVVLEYSNNPNWDGVGAEPTGDTPSAEVKVYTWEIPVFKYTGNDEPLAGAGFTLYKDGAAVNLVASEGVIYKVCAKEGCTDEHSTEIITGETGRFEIEGLEQGSYTLKETKTPAGYNKCADVTVVIGVDGVLTVGGTEVEEVKIENKSGSVLPETGGIGTTIFYVIGGVLMLAAVVLLVTKRRMATAK